jgi:hypothetical protein
MLSLLSKSLLVTLAVLLIALLTVFLIDEKSTSTAVSVCRLRDGSSVVVRTIYHSAFARLLRYLTGGQLYAITIWNRIYVSSDYLVRHGLLHEHEHVRQWHEKGPFRFLTEYLWGLWRVGYDRHPLELAARAVAGEIPWLR